MKFSPTKGGLRQYIATGVYYINARIGGRVVNESTETTSLANAKLVLAKRGRELSAGGPARSSRLRTMGQVIDIWKGRIAGSAKSQATREKDHFHLRGFLKSWLLVHPGRSFEQLAPARFPTIN